MAVNSTSSSIKRKPLFLPFLLLINLHIGCVSSTTIDPDASATQLILLSLARVEAALSRVDTLNLQSVEMAQKLDENSRELGMLDSKVSTLTNTFSSGTKADAADRVDVQHLEQAISAFRASEATEDIGDDIEQQEQTRLVAMAVDARRRLNVENNKQMEAEWVINLDWYFRTTVMAAAMFVLMYYNKNIIAWLQFNAGGTGQYSHGLQGGRRASQRRMGEDVRENGRDRDRGRDRGRDTDRDRYRNRDREGDGHSRRRITNDTTHLYPQQQQHQMHQQQQQQHHQMQLLPAASWCDESVGSSDNSSGQGHPMRQNSIDKLIDDDFMDPLEKVEKLSNLTAKVATDQVISRAGSFAGSKEGSKTQHNLSESRNPFDTPTDEASKTAYKYALRWLTKAHVGGREDRGAEVNGQKEVNDEKSVVKKK